MNSFQQRVRDSLDRVRVFIDTHESELGTVVNSSARKALAAALDGVQVHQDDQGTAVRDGQGRTSQRAALARDLAKMHMIPIAKFARTRLRDVPEIADLTKPVDLHKQQRLVSDARTMANVAGKYFDQFVAESFPADFVDQLRASADALDAAMKGRIASTTRRKSAGKSIDRVLQEGRDAVAVIDVLIKRQVRETDPLLATWKTESRIFDKPGKVRPKADPKGEASTPAVVPTSVPKAA